MHLYIMLQCKIGLKSFIVMGVAIWGTKAILVVLTHLGIIEELKKYLSSNEISTNNVLISLEEQKGITI
jgi:hypothetical protein